MPSALSRSYSVPVSLVQQQDRATGHEQQIDPKAVGAHRILSRRRSNPPGSPDSDDSSSSGLFGGDSLTSLSSLMQQLASAQQQQQQQQQHHRGHRKLDRSQSEPVQQQQIQSAQQSNSSRYKTELCRPFEENGTCKYGDKCQFAHGFHELRSLVRHPKYKTELCRTFHTIGFCPYGPRCHFIHNAEEARSNQSPPPPNSSPISSTSSSNASAKKVRAVFNLPGNGSTADSPSPPSSLSESPTSMCSPFFGSDDLFPPGNPFSPAAHHGSSAAAAFLFGSTLFPSISSSSSSSKRQNHSKFELDSPSPVGSLSSDLDSLSLGGGSPSPPLSSGCSGNSSSNLVASQVMDVSRALRLPIFSRISETLNED